MSRIAQMKDRLAADAADTQPNGTVARRIDPAGDLLAGMEAEFRKALPAILPVDTFIRIALTGLRRSPQLLECHRPTLLGALMECARLGLDPATEYASLVPFKNGKAGNRLDCQLIIGYQGYVQLMYRSGQVERVECELVHEADEFDYSIGDGGRFYHKPALHLPPAERGKPIYAYAFAALSGGGRTKVALTPWWQADAMRKKYGRVWNSDFEMMWLKTPLRQVQKYAPKSSELRRALAVDGAMVDLGGAITRPDGADDLIDVDVIDEAPVQAEPDGEGWPDVVKPPTTDGN